VSHLVLSRKYRPQGFQELVGQEHVARILGSAIAGGRVGHAYLFVGPRGVGKTTSARIFAKAINCAGRPPDEKDPDPCGHCISCVDITRGNDLDVVEIDAASNNAVDDVRTLREQVGYAPVRSPFRIWIVDEVHMLSLAAFNAFLKTLEEPPPHVKFLFCTTEEQRLPSTFRSRCQVVEFRPIAPGAMAQRLAGLAEREGVTVEAGVLERVATGALGGLRDAESLLEQLFAAALDKHVTLADYDALSGRAPEERLEALLAAIAAGDAGAALDALGACLAGASKPGVLMDQWLEAQRRQLSAAARGADGGALARASRAVDVLLAKRVHLRAGADGALVLEAAAIELARLPQARDLDRLVEALRARASSAPAAASLPGAGPGGAVPRPAPSASAAGSGAAASDAPLTSGASSRPAASPASGSRSILPTAAVMPPAVAVLPPAAQAGDLGRVSARWEALVEVAGRRDVRLRDALRRAQPSALADGRLTLALGRGDVMARSTLERRDMQQALRQAVRDVLGLEVTLVLEAAVEAAARGDVQLREHPGVRLVAEATGGRVLQVEREALPLPSPDALRAPTLLAAPDALRAPTLLAAPDALRAPDG